MSHTYPLVENMCRYVISIVKKDKVDTLINHLNSVDPHIKFTMETPANDGSIPFLDTKCSPNPDSTLSTSVFRTPTHTNCYLYWNSNHLFSAKKAVIQALTYRAKYVSSNPQILAEEMDYLHRVLLKNSYPDWIIKYPEKKPTIPTENSDTCLEVNKNIFISIPCVPDLSDEFRFFDIPVYRSFSKEPTPLNPSICTPR